MNFKEMNMLELLGKLEVVYFKLGLNAADRMNSEFDKIENELLDDAEKIRNEILKLYQGEQKDAIK